MLNGKEQVEKRLLDEIKGCQAELKYRKLAIEEHQRTIEMWTEDVRNLEERISILQKFLLTLDD